MYDRGKCANGLCAELLFSFKSTMQESEVHCANIACAHLFSPHFQQPPNIPRGVSSHTWLPEIACTNTPDLQGYENVNFRAAQTNTISNQCYTHSMQGYDVNLCAAHLPLLAQQR